MHATCLTQFIHDFISRGEEGKLQICLLCRSMHLPITSSATGSNAPQTALHFIGKTRRKRTVISREGSAQKRLQHKKLIVKSVFSGDIKNDQNLFLVCLFLCGSFPIKRFL